MNRWLVGARPRTLPAAIVPVVVGSAVALDGGHFIWWRGALCLLVALALQVGVNYANDYSDGVRGADANRVGPLRLVASGLATAQAVKTAALLSLAIAAVAGAALSLLVDARLLAIGAACLAAAWFYTGGRRPYGYSGLGEVSVFVFFGLVATVGTAYVQTKELTALAFVAGAAVGALAVALLLANNLRDRPTDAAVGKSTLAVRLGDRPTRLLFQVCTTVVPGVAIAVAFLLGHNMVPALAYFLLSPVRRANAAVNRGAEGRELIAVLQATAKSQLLFGALFAIGIVL